ncbi:MAG: hypothetical protein R3B47_20720 [Bacteroidia bacterium]
MDADPLYQDKHGWNLGLRIFDIMLHIDLNKLDLAESMTANLRRHVQRYAEEDSREMAMYRFLNTVCRCSFDFEEAAAEACSSIARLENLEDWIPYSHEVIPYSIWIRAKREDELPFELMVRTLLSDKGE